MPNRSPAARAAGTTAHPGCDCDGACESSVSSACANTPFVSAASIGPHTIFEATTVATSLPPYTPANCIAARPGVNSEPEIIAANVSRICCFVFSVASSGNSRPLASPMYVLSLSMTGLTPCPVVSRLGKGLAISIPGGNAAVATAKPASSNRLRREKIVWPFSDGPYLFRSLSGRKVFPDGDGGQTVLGLPRLEAHQVVLDHVDFGSVLDEEDTLIGRNEFPEYI